MPVSKGSPFGDQIDADEVASDVATQAELDSHAGLDFDAAHSGWLVGTQSERPAAGTAGRYYVETDTHRIYRDDGNSWIEIARDPANIGASDLGFDPATQSELDSHTGDTANPHSVDHSQLGGVGSSDHHSRYSDSEARTAVGGQLDAGTYTGNGGNTGRTINVNFNASIIILINQSSDGFWMVGDTDSSEFSSSINAGSKSNVHLDANGDLVVGDGGTDGNENDVNYSWVAIG